jgi:aspartate racemase
MKTLAIIGGIGPESTIQYYRAVLSAYRKRLGAVDAPSILINSIDVNRLLTLAATDLNGLTGYLRAEIERMADAGASLGLLAANTPHVVFDDLARVSPIPLVSIVEATCEEAVRRGLQRLGLLGTRFTMSGQFYPRVLSQRGIEVVAPSQDEQAFVHDKYTNELLQNVFTVNTRNAVLHIIDRLRERDGVDGVILGGTELPLLLNSDEHGGVPLLDTARIHIDAAVRQLWL